MGLFPLIQSSFCPFLSNVGFLYPHRTQASVSNITNYDVAIFVAVLKLTIGECLTNNTINGNLATTKFLHYIFFFIYSCNNKNQFSLENHKGFMLILLHLIKMHSPQQSRNLKVRLGFYFLEFINSSFGP